ncbi:MAG: hypothetical protein FWE37_05910 [Spirochaetaceae bacterium]|nr:hypothetical protein [Spirochaetaceae bacterium]
MPKLNYKKIKKYLPSAFFSKKQMARFFLLGLIPLGAILLITIPVMAVRNFQSNRDLTLAQNFIEASGRTLEQRPHIHNFIFPGNFLNFSPSLAPVRPSGHVWSEEEVARYWVQIESLALSSLPHTNESLLREFLNQFAQRDANF